MEELQKKTEWDRGFDAGQDFVLAMIKDLAGVEFKSVTELNRKGTLLADGTFVKEK